MSKNYKRYKELMDTLESLKQKGLLASDFAEELREEGDHYWNLMTQDERDRFNEEDELNGKRKKH